MVSSGSFDLDYWEPMPRRGHDGPESEDEAPADFEIEQAAQDALTETCQECGTRFGGHSHNCSQVN